MTIIETLTMAEIDEISQLVGIDFMEIMENGLKPGRPMSVLAWVVEKRTNPAATIDQFQKMTLSEMAEYLKGHADPKAPNTSS